MITGIKGGGKTSLLSDDKKLSTNIQDMVDKSRADEIEKMKKPMIDLRLKKLANKKILKLEHSSASLEEDGLKMIELIFNQKH